MIVFTPVIAIGIILGAFLLALLWSVDFIDRVEPLAADYRRLPYYSVLPLNPQVVQVARIDRGDLIPSENGSPQFTQTPSVGGFTATFTPALTESPGTSNASPTVGTTSGLQATASFTPTPTPTLTPTPTRTGLVTQVSTPTPRSTNPRPTQSNPTITPPAASATQPRPSVTQQLPTATLPVPTATPQPPPTSIPPTQPPPTRTRDPYPPPPTPYPQ